MTEQIQEQQEKKKTVRIEDYEITEINPNKLEKMLVEGISLKQMGRPVVIDFGQYSSFATGIAVAIQESTLKKPILTYKDTITRAYERIKRKRNLPDFFMISPRLMYSSDIHTAFVFYKIMEKRK
jgi:hypothetical protein